MVRACVRCDEVEEPRVCNCVKKVFDFSSQQRFSATAFHICTEYIASDRIVMAAQV